MAYSCLAWLTAAGDLPLQNPFDKSGAGAFAAGG
jgi:hypothetical protein